jgi:hypothetical protein
LARVLPGVLTGVLITLACLLFVARSMRLAAAR